MCITHTPAADLDGHVEHLRSAAETGDVVDDPGPGRDGFLGDDRLGGVDRHGSESARSKRITPG